MKKKELVGLAGQTLKTERPHVSDDIIREHIKVLGNKVLLRVLRKKHSGILTVDDKSMEFEDYFPIIAVGDTVRTLVPGDFAGLEPGGKWGVTKLFGEEFLIVDSFRIDHAVSEHYAKTHDSYKDDSINIMTEAVKAEAEARSELTASKDDVKINTAILGSWKDKSKPN